MMSFEDSLKFRHACKIFDDKLKISDENFSKIIEAGRLSPSSLGLEPWDFLLVKNTELKQRLKKECWDQAQITTASHLLVVFAKISDLYPGSEYIKDMVSRRTDKNSNQHATYIEKIENFIRNNVGLSDLEIFAWSKAQTFLAVQNMMSMAAVLGIDSCPMEGWFSEKNLDAILTNDSQKRRIAVILSFGYRLNEQSLKIRRSVDEILKVIH
ncbi:NAD(P)H-dependent oxidoreductase [Campylobacter corcagiensis]|uniref:NAD(P)H-dependent oxidoreductase n=1 Tax=Campylobacter corcagiensis TaxID=1448857 RepID=A0A7M1LES3_9BACT|nr:NAD(P)H-dependent oxidoreductase [Campylobacter corcagiensis]QKF65305.1 nitroreductase family protein [Campylobacter corcagiensis]QOQ86564.1 NAD(P)H-dependent oxidoreductase [Campylobacter corcagiensis]